jgi:hypothetical protein
MRNEQEEKKAVPATASAEDNIISVTSDLLMKDSNNPEVTLNNAQIDLIEKEVNRKLKKERTFEGGMKQVREKAPFHL